MGCFIIKKYINLRLLFFIIFFSVIFIVSSSISQSPPINQADLKYNVKVGDTNTYVVTKAQIQNQRLITSGIQLKNGTFVQFNLTKGMKFEIKVVAFNTSSLGIEKVFIQQTVDVKGLGKLTSSITQSSTLIYPAFDNETSAIAYYNATAGYYSFQDVKINGDFIVLTTNSSSGQMNNIYSSEFNWKTGWLEKTSILYSYTNGTVAINYEIQRESSNLINSIGNFAITTTEVGSILIIVAIPVLIGLSYRSFSKSSVKRQSNITYSNYIKNKLKYSKPKTKTKPAHSADHALDMIDDILKETNTK